MPTMSDPKTYEGSCHCGAVRYQVTMAPPEKAYACNCSICARAGWLLAFVPEADSESSPGKTRSATTSSYPLHRTRLESPS